MWTLWWVRSASWRTNCFPHSSHLNLGLRCWCICSLSLAREANFLWQTLQVWSYCPLKWTETFFINHPKANLFLSCVTALLLAQGLDFQPSSVSGILNTIVMLSRIPILSLIFALWQNVNKILFKIPEIQHHLIQTILEFLSLFFV